MYLLDVLKEKNWTIDRLARRSDMSYSQTWDIVKNGYKPGTRIGNLEKIAEATGVSLIKIIEQQKSKASE